MADPIELIGGGEQQQSGGEVELIGGEEKPHDFLGDLASGVGNIVKGVADTVGQAGSEIGRDITSNPAGLARAAEAGLVGAGQGVLSLPETVWNAAAAGAKATTGIDLPKAQMAEQLGEAARLVDPQLANYQGVQGVGNLTGQLVAPGVGLKGAGLGAKLLGGLLTGEAYGAAGDISQRYQQGKDLDIVGALERGLPLAAVGGVLGGIHAAGEKAITGGKGGVAEAAPTPAEAAMSPEDAAWQAQVAARKMAPIPAVTEKDLLELIGNRQPHEAEAADTSGADAVDRIVNKKAEPAPVGEAPEGQTPDQRYQVVKDFIDKLNQEHGTNIEVPAKPGEVEPIGGGKGTAGTGVKAQDQEETKAEVPAEPIAGEQPKAENKPSESAPADPTTPENKPPAAAPPPPGAKLKPHEMMSHEYIQDKYGKNVDEMLQTADGRKRLADYENEHLANLQDAQRAGVKLPAHVEAELPLLQQLRDIGTLQNKRMTDQLKLLKAQGGTSTAEARDAILEDTRRQFDPIKQQLRRQIGEIRQKHEADNAPAEEDPVFAKESISSLLKGLTPQKQQQFSEEFHRALDNIKGSVTPKLLSKLMGVKVNSDIVRDEDVAGADIRDRYLADREKLSVGVEHPRTEKAQEAWDAARKMQPDEIRSSPELSELNDKQREFLANSKELDKRYAEEYLKPTIQALKDAGVSTSMKKSGIFSGKRALLGVLEDDLNQIHGRSSGQVDEIATALQGGIFRSIFLGNQHTSLLHLLEAGAAGGSFDPVNTIKAGYKLISDPKWRDFATEYKTKGEEGKLADARIFAPGRLLAKHVSDPIVEAIQKMPHGGTVVDLLRAQLPEKIKGAWIRSAMVMRAADEMKYPGGAEALRDDLIASAKGKTLPPEKQTLVSKAELDVFRNMNRLIMHSPLGWQEKTLLQRHAALKWTFPFMRSILQQSRLWHSYVEDFGEAAQKRDARGLGVAASRMLLFSGVLATVAGSKALPKEVDAAMEQYAPDERKKLHEVLDAMAIIPHMTGFTVEHVQPRIAPLYYTQPNEFLKGLSDNLKVLTGEEKVKPGKQLRAYAMAASMMELDNIAGLIGTDQARQIYEHVRKAQKGVAKKAASTQADLLHAQKYLGSKTFKTDAAKEAIEWFYPGVRNDVLQWIDHKQEQDFEKQRRKRRASK